jgi:hypothetical protein
MNTFINISCWNLVYSTYSILPTKPTFQSTTANMVRMWKLVTYNTSIQFQFTIFHLSQMVYFIAHLIACKKKKKKTKISVLTLRHAHYTSTPTTIAHIIPKITTSFTRKEPTCYWARIRKHQCPTIQFFVCKDREQQHAAIRKLVCNNNKGIGIDMLPLP